MDFAIGWDNYCSRAGGSWALSEGLFPANETVADRMLDPRLAVAATGGESAVNFTRTFAAQDVPVQLIGVLSHTLPADVIINPRLLNFDDDVAWNGMGMIPWVPPTADFQRHTWWLLPYPVMACKLSLGTGTLAEQISVGAIWASRVWMPPDGLLAGWQTRVIDPGTLSRSAGGQGYPRLRQRYRQFTGQVSDLARAWAYGAVDSSVVDLQQLLYGCGTTDPVVVLPRTRDAAGVADVHAMHRLGVYGHLDELGEIRHQAADLYEWSGFRVTELL